MTFCKLDGRTSIPDSDRNSDCQNVQTARSTHPAFHPMSFGDEVADLRSQTLHLIPRLQMRGILSSLRHASHGMMLERMDFSSVNKITKVLSSASLVRMDLWSVYFGLCALSPSWLWFRTLGMS